MKDYVKEAADSIRYMAEDIVTKHRIELAARTRGIPVDDFEWEPCGYSGLTLTLQDIEREEFRTTVTKVAAVLGPPEIETGKASYVDRFQVTATWKGVLDGEHGKLNVTIVAQPKDCKLAEVEEVLPAMPERTVKVLKPHPECVEAIRQLEEAL